MGLPVFEILLNSLNYPDEAPDAVLTITMDKEGIQVMHDISGNIWYKDKNWNNYLSGL